MMQPAPFVATFIAVSLLFWGCASRTVKPIAPAFYYWQTTLSLSPAQQHYLRETRCRKIYVKILDVGLEPGTKEIIPFSQLQIKDTSGLSAFEIVQTVFITNEVFQRISPEKTAWLAERIVESRERLVFPATTSYAPEIQVDCDWTASTRDAFFGFLKILRTKLPPDASISATIRLHQYKFPDRTGVPPADRGMLMCYNTGDIDDPASGNSIFDPEEANKYLLGAPDHYPLPLDLALPVFSWILVYRDEELWKIIPGTHHQIQTGLVEKGTFLSGHYLRPGDLLRRETISADLLKKAAQCAATTDLADDATLAFFHLDSTTERDYPVQLIDDVCKIADSIRTKK